MPAFTGLQLFGRAKTMADMRDNFVTPEEGVDWINYEAQALDVFTARAGWVIGPMTVQSAPAPVFSISVAPATAVLAIIGVYEYEQGQYRRIPLGDIIDFQRDSTADTGVPVCYTVEASGDGVTIRLHPGSNNREIKVVYMAAKASITDLINTVGTYPLGFEERIVLRLARRMLIKEESDISGVNALLKDCETTISEICWNRSIGESGKVRNSDYAQRGWSSQIVIPESSSWAWV